MPDQIQPDLQALTAYLLISEYADFKIIRRPIEAAVLKTISKPILKAILTDHLKDLEGFYAEIVAQLPPDGS